MIRKFLISLYIILSLFITSSYAGEQIISYDVSTISVLNEELRKLNNKVNNPVLPAEASTATTAAPTSDAGVANKKYVDDQIAAIPDPVGLGDWVDKSASYGAQQAATDGFVLAYTADTEDGFTINGYTDAAADPTTLVAHSKVRPYGTTGSANIMFPVKKNNYWKVVLTNVNIGKVYWIPLGT